MIIALWDPLAISQIGFQFSFGITASILLWFEPCDVLLQKIFPKRSLSQVVDVGWLDQHGYCLLAFLRQALALTIAVNLVALPLTLYHFHKFPWIGLIYNLFFPFLVSFSMLFLLLATFFTSLIPIFSHWLHAINESYTQILLNFVFHFPKAFDNYLQVTQFSEKLLLLVLIPIFLGGIYAKVNLRAQENI